MDLILYAHPFSSYCQKVLIALYETGARFEYRMLAPDHPGNLAALAELSPVGKFPILVADGQALAEATIIIEFLSQQTQSARRLIPDDAAAALEVRFMDRIFDNYVSSPQQKFVFDALRPKDMRDPHGVTEAGAMLERAYDWLERKLDGRRWAIGDTFTMADCAAGPALFYADWTHEIPRRCPRLRAYRSRLMDRPSFARAIDEARPFRPFFPLGAPDRD